MGKNQNTFEKRRREMEKRRKAEEKRERRRKRKEEPEVSPLVPTDEDEAGQHQDSLDQTENG